MLTPCTVSRPGVPAAIVADMVLRRKFAVPKPLRTGVTA